MATEPLEELRLSGGFRAERGWWGVTADRFRDLLPKYPDRSVVPPAVVPPPPELPRGVPELLQGLALARGYHAAMVRWCGTSPFARELRPRSVVAHRHYPRLLAASRLMLQYRIAPAAWAAFSCDVWARYVQPMVGGAEPNPPWVLSVKRLEERTDWYEWIAAKFRGGRVHQSPTHRALLCAYESMQLALLSSSRKAILTRAEVQRVVSEHLPPVRYQFLVEMACAEHEVQQIRWNRAARDGAWLWG